MKETTLYATDWMTVIDRDGYIFTHSINTVVYLLPYRIPKYGDYLLGRFEVCPAHSPAIQLYALTGQCMPGDDPLKVAVAELYEEAGIAAESGRFKSLGVVYLTKQADTQAHLFSVDVTGLPQQEPPTDGSMFEQGGYCAWIPRNQALASPCIGLSALLLRAGM